MLLLLFLSSSLLLLLLFVELMLFVDVIWNLVLFADVFETGRRQRLFVVVVVAAAAVGLSCRSVSPVAVAIGNVDASSRHRRHVGLCDASQLVDDVWMRMMKRPLV